jgi:hypothetical protein
VETASKSVGWSSRSNTSNLVDREVGYVMPEEAVQLGVILKTDTISDMNTWMRWTSLL